MTSSATTAQSGLLAATLLASLAGFAPAAQAQTVTLSYNLEDVWVLPDITHPWYGPEQMTGSFEWTYTVGDFENGVGQFTAVDIPWYGTNVSGLNIMFDLGSIEFTLVGNWHGQGVDITLFLLTDLDPKIPSVIDTVRSQFHVESGVSYIGHVISGSIVPDPQLNLAVAGACPTVQISVEGAVAQGQLALLYAFGPGSFVVPGGFPCAGTVLGLDGTTALGATLNADAAGSVVLNTTVPASACGQIYLQALDLTSCGLSQVVLLQ